MIDYARERRDLIWYMGPRDGEIRRDVRSCQSAFEAQMDARAKSGRHTPLAVHRPGEDHGEVLWRDTGLRSGTVYVGAGDEGATVPRGMDDLALQAVREEGPIHALDPEHRHILELRFGRPLHACDSCALGLPNGKRACLIPFGFDGQRGVRGRPTGWAMGVPRAELRGAGTVAHLTFAARTAFGGARTRRDQEEWIQYLGGQLCRAPDADPALRALGVRIVREAEAMTAGALESYRVQRKGLGSVPAQVRRRALAR